MVLFVFCAAPARDPRVHIKGPGLLETPKLIGKQRPDTDLLVKQAVGPAYNGRFLQVCVS